MNGRQTIKTIIGDIVANFTACSIGSLISDKLGKEWLDGKEEKMKLSEYIGNKLAIFTLSEFPAQFAQKGISLAAEGHNSAGKIGVESVQNFNPFSPDTDYLLILILSVIKSTN